ncbi:MAG: Hsp70 family protein [Defluviitaleaceae bacterium]|nr:Hsp70 family protein [Defluviitaleaceae bacterium]
MKAITIGIDFGTTNTTIAYKDGDRLETFRIDAHSRDYTPTVIAYHPRRGPEGGERAKDYVTNQNYETYENFKLALGLSYNEAFKCSNDRDSKTPTEITKDYIGWLLRKFEGEHQKIDEIIITIPVVWYEKEDVCANIEKIFKSLGYENIELQKEPEAAAAYFCHSYKQKHGKEFLGDILVVDYGGGTLDLTHVKPKGLNEMVAYPSVFGTGNEDSLLGYAGVAFDTAATKELLAKIDVSLKEQSPEFIQQRIKFEKEKISKDNVSKDMREYLENEDENFPTDSLFEIEYNGQEIEVHPRDLAKAFRTVCKDKLETELSKMIAYLDRRGVNYNDRENFKILLVGGFSNYIQVELQTRAAFNSRPEDFDKKFEYPFRPSDKTYAIAKGAALAYDIKQTAQATYGVVGYYVNENLEVAELKTEIVKEGEEVSNFKSPRFAVPTMQIKNKDTFTIYTTKGGNEQRETIENTFGAGDYQIGIALDKRAKTSFYVKDEEGKEQCVVRE